MGRGGQKDQEFEVILSYITNTRPASKTKNKKGGWDSKEESGRKERKNIILGIWVQFPAKGEKESERGNRDHAHPESRDCQFCPSNACCLLLPVQSDSTAHI